MQLQENFSSCGHGDRSLLRDHPASNAVPGVARRICLHVVGFGVNHQRRSTVTEERVAVRAEIDVFDRSPEMRVTLRVGGEVIQIAGVMAFRILQAMLLVVRIEVWSRRLEIRSITFRVLVNVNGVLSRRQAFKVGFNSYRIFLLLPQDRGANAIALRVCHFNHGLGGAGQ